MRRTTSVLLAATLALGAVAAHDAELAEHPCYDEEADALAYPEQRVWFEEGESKVGNTAESPHPWGTTEPASVQSGAGAGQLSLSSQADTEQTPTVFEGTVSGCIDTMLFDLYSFDPANRSSTAADAQPNDHTVSLRITVDGYDIHTNGTLQTATTYANEAMGPNLNRFAVEIGDSMEQIATIVDGFTLDGEHTVTVEVAPYYINTGAAVVYAWDTSETPSGITFNGAITEEYPTG